jgi:hypothetical protein
MSSVGPTPAQLLADSLVAPAGRASHATAGAPPGADAATAPAIGDAPVDVRPGGARPLDREVGPTIELDADQPPPRADQHLELPGSALVVVADADRPSLPALLRSALFGGPLDETLARRPGLERQLRTAATELAARAYPEHRTTARQSDRWIDHEARDQHQRALLTIYQQHMRLPHHGMAENQFHPLACELLRTLEQPWERDILARARRHHDVSPATLPLRGANFAAWYQQAAFTHPLYEHELYAFLASEASRPQIEWFLTMEAAGEAAFDDLVALGQVGTRGEVKMEMAQNYWDEMGNGKAHAVHTHLFHRLTEGLAIAPPEADDLPWQVLGGVNVMLWACIPRRNAFRAQGALGAVELLAPQRCTRLVHGALRLGIAKRTVSYYGAHAIIDIGHAEGWLEHVVAPQVDAVPDSRVGIAEGLLVRADASLDYFDYCLTTARAMS